MSRSSAVDFTLRANITDLKSELGKIPGITDKEARKMAGAMEKGLLRAEKAAKKAGQAMRGDLGKSVDQAIEKTKGLALAAGMSEESFDKLKTSATKVAGQVDNFADKAGRADSSMSSMAAVIHNVNPELAELTRQAGDALGAVEGLILAAAKSPVTFAATAAAVGGLYLAFGDVNGETERYEAAAAKAEKASKKLTAATSLQSDVTERLRQKQAEQSGENLKIHDDFEQIDRDLLAVAARYEKLAKQGTVSYDLAEAVRAQTMEQRELNEEIYQYEIAQDRANKQNKIAIQSAKDLKIVSNQRIVSLRASIDNLEKQGDAAQASYARQQLGLELAEAKAADWAETQRQTLRTIRDQNDALGRNNDHLLMGHTAYELQIKDAEVTRDALEKLTGSTFRFVDANGRLFDTREEWFGKSAGTHKVEQISLGLLDEKTGKIYTAAEAVAYEQRVQQVATAEAVDNAKARGAAEKQSAQAYQEAAAAMLATATEASQARSAATVDAFRVQADAQRAADEEWLTSIEKRAAAEAAAFDESQLTAIEKIESDRAAQLQELEILRSSLDARAELTEETERRIAAARVEINYAANSQIEAEHRELVSSGFEHFRDLGTSMLSDLGTFLGQAAEDLSDEDRARAMKLFRAKKAIAISEALMSGAVGMMAVWQKYAAVPPVAAFMSTAVAAQTALQVATIKAEQPSFHAGGIMPASDPSEFSARILPGESVLNQRATAALGESGVNALNHGTGSPSIQVVPIPVYKHFDRFIRDEDKRRGRFSDIIQRGSSRALGQRGY